MELIERDGVLKLLQEKFDATKAGEGHCILLGGEAGIGKSSLVNVFCKNNRNNCNIFIGTCDALFTPRPLAPLYDIAWQLEINMSEAEGQINDRAGLFARFFHKIYNQPKPAVLVFEDIHWADDATLDFIKFLARRIAQTKCLFILTYREDEVHSGHALRNLFGQLPVNSYTRVSLPPLSKESVLQLASTKGYDGENVFRISGGNPFYVNEILASYSHGIPQNIKDSVLSVFNRVDGKTKDVWELLSVIPTVFEIDYLEKTEPAYAAAIENCLATGVLIIKDGLIQFKHELYRRTIENSLSPFVRVALHKKILDLLRQSFESNKEIERIVHHAKNANEYGLVTHYAPIAAKHAASIGAHTEAAKLYLTAIEYYQENDNVKIIDLCEYYSYECYLVNHIEDAIIYEEKALNALKKESNVERVANSMRLLSRLWWFDGRRKKAESYAGNAVALLENESASKTKAMSLSNMSQLKMLSDQHEECIYWGELAIAMAKELDDEETVAHALNNVGTVQVRKLSTRPAGIALLQQSLAIALKNKYEEQAARAYINLGSNAVKMKDYAFADRILHEGISYCEERGLEMSTSYLLAYKARMNMENGNWDEALAITSNLIKNEQQPPVVKICALTVTAIIYMRRGNDGAADLLEEAKLKSAETMEPQRIIPVVAAMLEYEWLTGKTMIENEEIENAMLLIARTTNPYETGRVAFWLSKSEYPPVTFEETFEGYMTDKKIAVTTAAALWKKLDCPYEEAIILAEGNEPDKKNALLLLQKLGAVAVYEKLKRDMRVSGIKAIPRGIRKSTLANPAFLTARELDILELMKEGMQNKEIAAKLFIATKTVDHHISSIFFKLDVNTRSKAVREAAHRQIIK